MRLLYSWQESPSAQTPCTEKTVDTHKNTVPITSCQSQSPFLGSSVKFSWAIGRPTQTWCHDIKKRRPLLFRRRMWRIQMGQTLNVARLTQWNASIVPVIGSTDRMREVQRLHSSYYHYKSTLFWADRPSTTPGAMHLGFICVDNVEYGTVDSSGGDVADGYQGEGRKTTRFPQLCSILGSHYGEMSFQ